MLLARILELVLIVLLVRTAVSLLLPQRAGSNRAGSKRSQKRFDAKGQDVADGDFEEVR